MVLEHEPNTAFLIIGGGSLKEELAFAIKKSGLNNNVFLLDIRNDVEEILQITDVGVLTSDTEGLPNTVIEMLASGVPVVATNCGGTLEVLDDGQTGFCVGINDEYAMAQQTLRLLRDDALRRTMGLMGKHVARERFSLNKMTETTQSIYRELLRYES